MEDNKPVQSEDSTDQKSQLQKPAQTKVNADQKDKPAKKKRPYVSPVFNKYDQIDYVTAYGVD